MDGMDGRWIDVDHWVHEWVNKWMSGMMRDDDEGDDDEGDDDEGVYRESYDAMVVVVVVMMTMSDCPSRPNCRLSLCLCLCLFLCLRTCICIDCPVRLLRMPVVQWQDAWPCQETWVRIPAGTLCPPPWNCP